MPDESGSDKIVKKSETKSSNKKNKSGKSNLKSSCPLSDLPNLQITCNFQLLPVFLFVLALGTRFYGLDQPNAIVFDELHYGRYAGLYLKQTFFFDSHPPLGKQLLALAGYMSGFQGAYIFSRSILNGLVNLSNVLSTNVCHDIF